MNISDATIAIDNPLDGCITISSVTTYSTSADQTSDVGYTISGVTIINCQTDGASSAAQVICTKKYLLKVLLLSGMIVIAK